MTEPDSLPLELEAEMRAVGDRAAATHRRLGMLIRNVDIADFMRRNEPELWSRVMLASSPEVRRKVETARQAFEDGPKDLKKSCTP